jgi:peptidoglycan/LPS O-acetylase OafA/YrhL
LCIFPAACLLLTWFKAAGWKILLAASLLTALALPWADNPNRWTLTPPPVAMISFEFLAGAMFYGLRRHWLSPSKLVLNTLIGVAVGIAFMLLARPGLVNHAGRPVLVGCFGLAILALSYGRGIFSDIMSVRPLVYLGEISYSLYLTHEIVQRVLKVILHPGRFDQLSTGARALYFMIYWAAILSAAAALYHLVENPCRHYLRNISPFENSRALAPKYSGLQTDEAK